MLQCKKLLLPKTRRKQRAAFALLEELKAEPRKETLDVSIAQLKYAQASLKNVQEQLQKLQKSYKLNLKSVSKNDLDNAINGSKELPKQT